MRKLVVHHTYETSVPFDVSRTGNHGIARAAAPDGAGSYVFAGGSSRVMIPMSPSLRDLRSLRVCCRFLLTAGGASRRNNLVEGHMSFALYVEPDGALQATIYDRSGVWEGPRAPRGSIRRDVWHTADFRHDGISHARLFVDGVLVAERFDVPGPVRTPGPYGIAVGAWPDPDDRYTLQGRIDDVMIYKHDPTDPQPLIDDCCLDRDALDEVAARVRDAGWSHADVNATLQRVLDLGTRASVAARAGDAARTQRLSNLTKQGVLAVKMRDPAALAGVISEIQDMVREKVGDAEITQMAEQAYGLFTELPLFEGEAPEQYLRTHLHDWAAMLCLQDLLPPSREPRPRKPRPRPEGDPDTDQPDGEARPGWDDDLDDEPDPNSPLPEPDRPEPDRPEPDRPKPSRPVLRPDRPDFPRPQRPILKPPRPPGDDD